MTSNLLKADGARDSPSPERKGDAPPLDSSPSVTSRISYQMVGGIHIPNEEGVRWYECKYGRELPKDHRGDMRVRMELERVLTEEEGEPLGVEYAPRRDTGHWYDFLAATQLERGVWEHHNPDGFDEVSLPEQQMKGESAREDQMRATLRKLVHLGSGRPDFRPADGAGGDNGGVESAAMEIRGPEEYQRHGTEFGAMLANGQMAERSEAPD
ncbi:hypothetical protein K438DRAFT_2029439 [Mycena galopus ATCC 62051]|nr:hypothetical protein K438DRAFT_2029439 [Mycena galopus ATCC 62051]